MFKTSTQRRFLLQRQLFDSKLFNYGFSPIIAIILGIFITLVIHSLLVLILDINSSSTTFGVLNVIIGVISIAIGAFVTTFLVKGKKLHYGIYESIIIIIFITLAQLYGEITQNSTYVNNYILLGTIISYFLSGVIGSYLGIVLAINLKAKQ